MKVPTLEEIEKLPWTERVYASEAAIRSAQGAVSNFVLESARVALLRDEDAGLTYTLLASNEDFEKALHAQLVVNGSHHWLTQIMELAQEARKIQRQQHEGEERRLDKARNILEFLDEMKKLERKVLDPSYLLVRSQLGYMVGQATTDVKVKTAKVQVRPPGLGWADYTFSRKKRAEVWTAAFRFGVLEIAPQDLFAATGVCL